MEIFVFVPNESGRIHEHKALVSPFKRRVQNQHMVTVSSVQLTAFAVLLLTLAVIKQHYCERPLLDLGELPVFDVRPHAPNREVRTVTVQYEYMYGATPYIYIYIYTHTYTWVTLGGGAAGTRRCSIPSNESKSQVTFIYIAL